MQRWGRSLLPAVVATVAVSTGLMSGVEAGAAAAATSPNQMQGAVAAEDPFADASRSAVEQGSAVPVEEATTPTSTVTAQPDGTFVASISPAPTRVLIDGEWVDLDPTLKVVDGRVVPTVANQPITFSNGGSEGSPLVTVGRGEDRLTLLSPFALPTPELSGDFAVYPEVMQDVDLVVKSTEVGFTYNWVVKTAEAATSDALSAISIPLDSQLEPVAEHGGVSFRTTDGLRRFWTPAPTMWDSSGTNGPVEAPDNDDLDPEQQQSVAAVDNGPDLGDQVAPVQLASTSDELTLTPNTALLTDPDTVFPVVVDPAVPYDKYRNGWTAVWDNQPSHSFWQTDHSLGAGYEGYEQFKVVRSYFRFGTSALAGKQIVSAELNVRQIHAASCQARPTQAYRTGAISPSTTWNNQPTRYGLQDTSSSTVGCGSGTDFVGWDVTSGIKTSASENAENSTFMLRAQNEADKIAWKQFDDFNAELSVKYVSRPDQPTGVKVGNENRLSSCTGTTFSEPLILNTTSLKTTAIVHSDDKDQVGLRGQFMLTDSSAGTTETKLSGLTGDGGQATVSFAVANTRKYKLIVKTRAEWDLGTQTLLSDGTTPCFVKIDTTRPDAPIVTASTWAECAAPEAPETCPVGPSRAPGSITIKSNSSDVTAYQYALNGDQWSPLKAPSSAGGPLTIPLTPTALLNTLRFKSIAPSGESETGEFSFRVAPVGPVLRWTFDGQDPTANSGSAASGANLTLANPATANTEVRGRAGTALRFAGSPATTPGSSPSTSSDFTVATWVRLSSTTAATLIAGTDGTQNTFELGYNGAQGWVAGRRASSDAATLATSDRGVTGAWTHLAATFTTGANKVTLYVNGVPQGSVAYSSSPWSNSAGWRLGCGRIAGADSRCMNGVLDEAQVYDTVLFPDEIRKLADPVDLDSNKPYTGSAALWSMSDPEGSATAIDSVFGTNLTVSGAGPAPFGTASDGSVAGVLKLPGDLNQRARTATAPLDSTGSFTVTAKVRLTDATRSGVIAQQRGVNRDAWTLSYKYTGTGGQFVFQRSATDTVGSATTVLRSPEVTDLSAFTSKFITVTAVYSAVDTISGDPLDPTRGTIRLYVTGRDYAAGPDPLVDAVHVLTYNTPWLAREALDVGNGVLNGAITNTPNAPLRGEISSLELRAGAADTDSVYNYFLSEN